MLIDRDLGRWYFLIASLSLAGFFFLFLYAGPYIFKVASIILLAIGVTHLKRGIAIHRYYEGLKKLKTYDLSTDRVPAKKGYLFFGRGFMWDNRHTQMVRGLTQGSIKDYLGENEELGGRSILHGVGSQEEEDIFIPEIDFSSHLSLSGCTRVGKTRFLEVLLSQIIKKGDPLIVMDPKGEERFLNFCYNQAIKAGREKKFVIFCPPHAKVSCTYNPLSHYAALTDIADRIVALLPQGGDSQAFTNFCHSIILATVEGLDYVKISSTFENIEKYALMPEYANDLYRKVTEKWVEKTGGSAKTLAPQRELYKQKVFAIKDNLEKEGRPVPDMKVWLDLNAFAEHPRENFLKMSNELTPMFKLFNAGKNRRLLSTVPADIDWQRDLDIESKIIYFYLGSLIGAKSAYEIGKITLQDLIAYIGRRYVYTPEAQRHPVWLVVDEFHNLCYPGFVDLISKAGGAGLRVIISMQSLADLEANMKWNAKAHAQQILDNTGTKICMRAADRYTADRFTSITGTASVSTLTESRMVTPEMDDAAEPFDTRYHATTAEQEVPLLRSNWINELPKGHAFMYYQGKTYKLKLPLFPDPERDFFQDKRIR